MAAVPRNRTSASAQAEVPEDLSVVAIPVGGEVEPVTDATLARSRLNDLGDNLAVQIGQGDMELGAAEIDA